MSMPEVLSDRDSNPRRYNFLLPPLLAFFGLALLLVFGHENWVYTLPGYEPDVLMLVVNGNPLHGQVQVPVAAKLGAHLKVTGWFGELAPVFQSQKIVVYLDDRRMGETNLAESTLLGANGGGGARIKNWQADFFMKDIPVGEHTLTVQSVPEGHAPVIVSQSALSVAP
jgi:hypothetical protein